MAYADLKNDFVFRKVFGHHPDVLVGLLNDLLDRQGSHVIVALEYLPPDQAPEVPGFKLSIVDVNVDGWRREEDTPESRVGPPSEVPSALGAWRYWGSPGSAGFSAAAAFAARVRAPLRPIFA